MEGCGRCVPFHACRQRDRRRRKRERVGAHSFARVTDSNATLAGDDGPHSDSASSAGGARSPCIRRIGSELSLEWGSNGDRPAPGDERRRRSRARQHVYQRVLDLQATRRTQPPRDLVPRVLQAPASAFLHRAADTSRRCRLRPFHGSRNNAGRSGVDGPPPIRLRREPSERRLVRAAPQASVPCADSAGARCGELR